MKNSSLIIKIAFGAAAAAALFSLVTLIRVLIVGTNAAFPVIQFVGSAVILVICFLMLRAWKNDADDAEDEDENEDEAISEAASQPDPLTDEDDEDTVRNLYEKYHLSDFEDK